jgi:hypothetical protein
MLALVQAQVMLEQVLYLAIGYNIPVIEQNKRL